MNLATALATAEALSKTRIGDYYVVEIDDDTKSRGRRLLITDKPYSAEMEAFNCRIIERFYDGVAESEMIEEY